MRLICPNCDAEYEVPDSVIPAEGRDVQCSNCGTTWFFDPSAPVVEEIVDEPAPEPQPEPTPEPAPEPEPTPEPQVAAAPQPRRVEPRTQPEFARPDEAPPSYPSDESQEPDPAPTQAPQRRPLDAEVADVLREEAAFEAEARAKEAPIEVQQDLGLSDPAAPEPADEIEVDEVVAATAASGSRRDLLPDIDEINSTLRATSDRRGDPVVTAEEIAATETRRRGFRTGFGLTLIVLGALAGIYSYAPDISAAVPSIEPILDRYVVQVNGLRSWLEQGVENLVVRLSGTTPS